MPLSRFGFVRLLFALLEESILEVLSTVNNYQILVVNLGINIIRSHIFEVL